MKADIVIVEAPYHLGVEGLSVGAGPAKLIESGADRVLGRRGRPAQVEHVRMWDARSRDLDAVVDVNRLIARAVREGVDQETLPVVLAGNCNSCLGTLAGLGGGDRLGVVWLDAHGDCNTPATSPSGLLEGMSLAMAVGLCHDDLRIRTGLQDVVMGRNVVMLGVRDLDPGEADCLAQNEVTVRPPAALDELDDLLVSLRLRSERVYLHLDVDVLEPSESPAVNHRVPGGLSLIYAGELLRKIVDTLPVAAIGVTNFNPELDQSGRSLNAILQLLATLRA